MLSRRRRAIGRALRLCAGAQPTPVLVHCTHGKDRTGVLVALLLHACGVPLDAICADYAATAEWCATEEGQAALLASVPTGLQASDSSTDYARFCDADPETISELFSRVAQRWGSVDGYLDAAGVDASVRARLREAYTEDVELATVSDDAASAR
jgi:protein-tyrosine phosphatase